MATRSGALGRERIEFADYKRWLLHARRIRVDERMENRYEVVCQSVERAFSQSDVWLSVTKGLRDLDDQYLIARKCSLMSNYDIKIVTKPFNSFLEKTYRKNILLNTNFPDPPPGGWLLPDDWFSRINDIARTTVTVRYLDGVEYILSYIQGVARDIGATTTCDYEASLEGYYAVHLYLTKDIDIVDQWYSKLRRTFTLEIQITTQIKELVKSILHSFYEKARLASLSERDGKNWRWDYKSDEFVASNLGHLIHYVEGMIVQVRDRQSESKK